MTAKELYELAKSNGKENVEIHLYFYCDDEYYSRDGVLTEENIQFLDNKIAIDL